MSTTAEKLNLLLNTKADIKAALAEKGQTASDVFSTYADKIRAIETYVEPEITVDNTGLVTAATGNRSVTHQITNTDDTDLIPSNIRKGTDIFGVTGSLEEVNIDSELSTQDDLIAKIQTALDGKAAATPFVTVDNAGLITATSGDKITTKQLTTKGAATYTPGTSDQTIASGQYLIGVQTIQGDANLVAENIKSGVSIFGVEGTMTSGGGAQEVRKTDLDGSCLTRTNASGNSGTTNLSFKFPSTIPVENVRFIHLAVLFASSSTEIAAQIYIMNSSTSVMYCNNSFGSVRAIVPDTNVLVTSISTTDRWGDSIWTGSTSDISQMYAYCYHTV